MGKYIHALIEAFERDTSMKVNFFLTLATSNLFQTRIDSERDMLKSDQKSQSHSTVVKLLFVVK